MKDFVDVALVQFGPRPLDLEGNLEAMADAVRSEAARHPTDLVVFPELATTGYVPPSHSDDFAARLARASDTVPGRTTDVLGRAARDTGTHVAVGLSERGEEGELFNSVLLIDPRGEAVGVHRKVHLWQQESHYFRPGNTFDVLTTDLGRIGLSVCYDSKFPEASRSQALAGAEILLCVFAYAPDPGVPADILTHRAVTRGWENSAFYVLGNQLGGEFVGRSVIAGPLGEVLTRAHDERDPVIRARLEHRSLTDARRDGDVHGDRRPDVYGDLRPVATPR